MPTGGLHGLERLQSAVRACGEYEVQFDLSTTDEQSVSGTYRVAGDCYFIALSEARVYCDGTVRYEVSDRAREVVIDAVDTASHNLLDNPVRAFDFVGEQYDGADCGGTAGVDNASIDASKQGRFVGHRTDAGQGIGASYLGDLRGGRYAYCLENRFVRKEYHAFSLFPQS